MRFNYLLSFPLFILSVLTSHAEVIEYDFEIVIFEDLSNRYIDSEQWPRLEYQQPATRAEAVASVNTESDTTIETTDSTENDVINVSRNDLNTLDKYTKSLNTSGRYNVLVHKFWRQTGLDAESALNILISSENDNEPVQSSLNYGSAKPGDKNTETLSSSIKGNIKIILGRYLHIYTDLIYRKPGISYPAEFASVQNEGYKDFSIKSHRRMRSKELHYIDHPLVGILVKALPVEQPEPATEEDAVPTQPVN